MKRMVNNPRGSADHQASAGCTNQLMAGHFAQCAARLVGALAALNPDRGGYRAICADRTIAGDAAQRS